MADKRSRIYYTQAQIQTGLHTEGGEWMFRDGTEYKGQYHKYTTGEVFTDSTYVDGKSMKLIPYVNIQESVVVVDTNFEINFTKNFEYDNIKDIDVVKSIIPNPSVNTKQQSDIKRGYMERYFAQKVNDNRLLELSQDDYTKVGTKSGLDGTLWKRFKIKWKITGPLNDDIDDRGRITESGIIETNQRTVQITSQDYPEISNLIKDFREFSEI